ncbi:MAG: AAA family ATPase [Planctomycetes bacterium]|nr:AAA family ATPase [Planctomycetota bacterium]
MRFALESIRTRLRRDPRHDAATLWDRLSGELFARLGPDRYTAWIENVRLVRADEDEIVVATSGSYTREKVEGLVGAVVQDCARRATNRKTRVVFTADPNLFPLAAPREFAREDQGFGSFAVARSNRIALRAAQRFADGLERTLILTGPSGSGKTHLLRAAARELSARRRVPVLFLTGDEFARQCAQARERRQGKGFRRRCLGAGAFFLDDLDFLCGRFEAQEEFLRTYLALVESGKRVALTCSRPPRFLDGLSRPCRARIRAQAEAELEPPDASATIEVLRTRAPAAPRAAIEVIANGAPRNLKDALSCLDRLLASGPPTPTRARAVVRESRERWRDGLSLSDIARAAADDFAVPVRELYSPSHRREAARARQACYYLARKLLLEPYTTIGRHFGGRNHSTVLLAVRKLERDGEMKSRVMKIERSLAATPGLSAPSGRS